MFFIPWILYHFHRRKRAISHNNVNSIQTSTLHMYLQIFFPNWIGFSNRDYCLRFSKCLYVRGNSNIFLIPVFSVPMYQNDDRSQFWFVICIIFCVFLMTLNLILLPTHLIRQSLNKSFWQKKWMISSLWWAHWSRQTSGCILVPCL